MSNSIESAISLIKSCIHSAKGNDNMENFGLCPADSLQIKLKAEGITSDVFKVTCGEKTLIVKVLSPIHKIVSPEYPLSPSRLKNEVNGMKWRNKASPASGPKLYHCDEVSNMIFMEDLDGWQLFQDNLMACRVDLVAIQRIAEILGRIHNASHVSNLDTAEFNQLKEDFSDGTAVETIQQFMFRRPFNLNDPTNKVKSEVEMEVNRVVGNESFMAAVERFRELHLTKQECVVHGDFNTSAVMIREDSAKVIHGGFCHVGPAALDLGMLLSNYMIAYHSHMLTEQDNDWHREVSYKMVNACHTTVNYYLENMVPTVGDRDQYVATLMSETAGFAGLDMIRRTIGAVRAKEITDSGSKELEVLQSGMRLFQACGRIQNIDRLLNIALMLTF